jgi:hypothetical protein
VLVRQNPGYREARLLGGGTRLVGVPSIMCAVFLRFVTTRMDGDSHRSQGVMVPSYLLLDSGSLTSDEWKRLREILDWFNIHLPHPPKSFVTGRAIFWFKSTATESISQIWELVHLLRHHSHHVEVHKCRRLANILYEDEFQVAAYPSKRDSKIRIR